MYATMKENGERSTKGRVKEKKREKKTQVDKIRAQQK